MLQISKLISQGAGLAPVLVKRASTVELDWDVRQKSRFDATDSLGRPLGAVHQPAGTAQGRDQGCLVGQVPGHELAAQRAQGVRAVRVPHQSAHAVPALHQQPRHLAAQEAGATGQEDVHTRTLVLCACPSRDLGVTGR